MRHRPRGIASRLVKGTVLTLLTAAVSLGSPWVAISAAQAGGADKPRPATFGDCKNSNEGVHNGYDCEEAPPEEEGLPG